MLTRQKQIQVQMQKLMDACLFSISLWLAHRIREATGIEVFGGTKEIEPFSQFVWLILFIFPFSPLVLDMQGFYNRPLLARRTVTIWQLLKACTLVPIGTILVMFLLKDQLARSVIMLLGPVSFCLMLLKDEWLRVISLRRIGRADFKRRLILVGADEDTARLERELVVEAPDTIKIMARLNLNKTSVERLVDLLHEHSVNGVILSAEHTYFGQVEQAIQACELEGVEAWLMADFFKTQISQTTLDDFFGRPMLVFRSTPGASYQAVAKQALDFLGALALLSVVGIPMLLVAVAIKVASPGPILFRQERSGLNGRPFTMLKFRSMVTNADQQKQELERLNEMAGPVFKVTNDPRVTPIGRFLRKYSIDEFPQLINVVRGEMSLVGPRPLPVDEVRRFDDLAHRRRLSVKPGLTCLWQISGRNNVTDFKDWVRLDLEYIDNWSLWLDLKILWRTIPVVLLGTGAK